MCVWKRIRDSAEITVRDITGRVDLRVVVSDLEGVH